MPRGRIAEDPIARFESKFIKKSEDECWPWQGKTDKDGYGLFWFVDNNRRSNRMAWIIYVGEIPSGMMVCHDCDNPGCVNPKHLFLGTSFDNNKDMYDKGRDNIAKGEDKWNATLTNEDIPIIREMLAKHIKISFIAQKFNTKPENIRNIKRGYTWKPY